MAQETDDPVKSQLLSKALHQREELEDEVKYISERTEKIVTTALIVGGALALTYFLMSQFSGSKSRKSKSKKTKAASAAADVEEEVEEPSEPNVMAQIGTALATQATAFLLSIAKEKLSEYLQAQQKKKDEHS